MTFVPIRTISSVQSAYEIREMIMLMTPNVTPCRQILPMNEATPAMTMTVIACVSADGSASIS